MPQKTLLWVKCFIHQWRDSVMLEIDSIIKEALDNDMFSGVTVEVGKYDTILYSSSSGYINRDKSQLVDKNTLFDMASVTKIFTMTSILKLITEKKISLDSKVVDFLEDLSPYLKEFLKDLLIKDLLTHGSGLHYWYPFYTSKEKGFTEVLEEVLRRNCEKKAGTYSDLNFILLGKIISKVTDLQLDKAVEKLILRPMEMRKTSYKPNINKNVASTEYGNQIENNMVSELGLKFGNFRNPSNPITGQVNDGNAYYYFDGVSGHAGIFSTIDDMRKIPRLYLSEGKHKGKQFIDLDLIEKSKVNYGYDRGLGWALKGIFLDGYGHTGFTGTSIFVEDSLGIYIIILSNRLNVENPVNINDFRMKIHQEVVNKLKEEK